MDDGFDFYFLRDFLSIFRKIFWDCDVQHSNLWIFSHQVWRFGLFSFRINVFFRFRMFLVRFICQSWIFILNGNANVSRVNRNNENITRFDRERCEPCKLLVKCDYEIRLTRWFYSDFSSVFSRFISWVATQPFPHTRASRWREVGTCRTICLNTTLTLNSIFFLSPSLYFDPVLLQIKSKHNQEYATSEMKSSHFYILNIFLCSVVDRNDVNRDPKTLIFLRN